MKTYREIVNTFKASELKYDFGRLAVAYELDCNECNLSDEDFEIACDYLFDYYKASEIGAQELVDKFVTELVDKFVTGLNMGEFTIDDCINDYEKVDNAIYNLL